MAGYFPGIAIDQPEGTSRRNSHAADSWLEPWLVKHVSFYRKHMTKDGKAESHATRRHSVISDALRSRENSIAEPAQDANEEQRGDSATDNVDAEQEAAGPASPASVTSKESKKDRLLYSWRSNMHRVPHP